MSNTYEEECQMIDAIMEEFEQLNHNAKMFVQLLKREPRFKYLELLRTYDHNEPEESIFIQRMIDVLTPLAFVGSEEEKVKQEIEKLSEIGKEIDTPEQESEWEEKIKIAREKDIAEKENNTKTRMEGLTGVVSVDAKKIVEKDSKLSEKDTKIIDLTAPVSTLHGIGAKSAAKLEAAGVLTIGAFKALSQDQRSKIVSPLVAKQFENL